MSEKKKFVTATQVEPDHTMKKKKGSIWCPYDAEWTIFKPKVSSGYPRCEKCGISDEDFWVKMSNKTWGMTEVVKPKRRNKK